MIGPQHRTQLLVALDSILQGDHRGIGAHQWLDGRDYMAVLVAFDREHHQVNRPDFRWVVGGIHLNHELAVRTDQFKSIGFDGLEVFAPADELHVVARLG